MSDFYLFLYGSYFKMFNLSKFHIYVLVYCNGQKDGNDNPICKTEKETQIYRTDFWTLWEKARVGCFERTASKHVYYLE